MVREAQEIVELAQKGMLRWVGVDPPKWHDVGDILLEHSQKFAAAVQAELPGLARISKRLRKERELSFYGDIDFLPAEEYTRDDALEAIAEAEQVVRVAAEVVKW